MPDVAIIEYFTASTETLIFLVKKSLSTPLVFKAPISRNHLLLCAQRLIIDFHGLPMEWESEFDNSKKLLSLPPAIPSAKRKLGIMQANLNKPSFSYELTYWDNLSEILFPNDLKSHIADCSLLCIVPHGPLHSLPFAALHWSEQEYLIERFGICYSYSSSVLGYCQNKNRKRKQNIHHKPLTYLSAAVAASDDQDPQFFEADGKMLEDVLKMLGNHHNLTCLVGAAPSEEYKPASKTLIKNKIQTHDVIHLACHGLFNLESPLDSGLLVSDGHTSISLKDFPGLSKELVLPFMLTAREVFGLNITTDLITLRACSSGRAGITLGDELFGLTRAFLYAGAPSLIVSQWNVHQHSSQLLLNEFYRLWLDTQQPLSKWQALQQAQKKLLNNIEYKHPYHWAPFILLGDWL